MTVYRALMERFGYLKDYKPELAGMPSLQIPVLAGDDGGTAMIEARPGSAVG